MVVVTPLAAFRGGGVFRVSDLHAAYARKRDNHKQYYLWTG
ncbi:Unannotated [Lentimonas sp. CC19]|nr:Unannotated [Lentimonas sp. CC10]CAA6697760.1 Unannotated [Lentimonas sp. CC19]CAA7071384.1 Unannotated [Lentimonas sp. CC11]